MDLTWTVDREDDASLVCCRVRNDGAVPRRVRIENRLDGPVLPPRRAGVPERGWDANGVTVRLAPGQRRALGFAVPAPPVEPPVEIIDDQVPGPVEVSEIQAAPDVIGSSGTESRGQSRDRNGSTATVTAALRALPEHRPPRAAVADGDATNGTVGAERVDSDDCESEAIADYEPDATATAVSPSADDAVDRTNAGDGVRGSSGSTSLCEWFAAVEERVKRAERLTEADLATATGVVVDAGGIDDLAALDQRVAADAERLREVSERAAALAARAEATDAPIEALERLA
ncbi:MAG: hypothetical protein ACOCRD_01950 [Halorubrum sp.]